MTDEKKTIEISYVPDDEELEEEELKEAESTVKKTPKKKLTPKELDKKLNEQEERLLEQEETLQKIIKERDEYKDNYIRNLAEVDNFRKRIQKEKEEYQKYALSEFLLDLLQVYDNLERALKAGTANNEQLEPPQKEAKNEISIVSGVEMIYKQFSDILKKYNVVEIDALDKPFDPNLHQALSKEEREGIAEPVVVEVYQKGFLYNGKLLKATLSKVAIPQEDREEEAKE